MGFSLREVEEATGGRLIGDGSTICGRVSIDSRRVRPGDLFVAIKGQRLDGHRFLSAAVAAGAKGLLLSDPAEMPAGVGTVLVEDTTVALGALARFHRRRFNLPVVAVTGSTGKTSVKEMIAAVGAVSHRVVRNAGNQNNQIGLPLTLLSLTEHDELLVVEMGMRGRGQLAYLAAVAAPDVGVVTNIGLTHLEMLGSQSAIAEAKGELIEALPPGGASILNADDPACRELAEKSRARVVTYGLSEGAAVRGTQLKDTESGGSFILDAPAWPRLEVTLGVPGRHQVSNALAAAAVAHALGYCPNDVREGLAGFAAERGRGAAITTDEGWTVIDDTYNANPASVAAALQVLRARRNGGKKIAVLGEMLELGPAAPAAHRETGRIAAEAGLTMILATGELAREIVAGAVAAGFPASQARYYADKGELLADLRRVLRRGDTVLVKGSRGMHMEEVVGGLVGE